MLWGTGGTQGLYRPLVLVSYRTLPPRTACRRAATPSSTAASHATVSLLVFLLVRGIGGSLLAAGVWARVRDSPMRRGRCRDRRAPRAARRALLLVDDSPPSPCACGAGPALVRAAAAACFASALLSKESAMTLVLVLPVMDALVPAVRRDGQPAGLRLRSSSITCRSRWSLSSISPCVAPCSRASSSAVVVAAQPPGACSRSPRSKARGSDGRAGGDDGVRGRDRVCAAARVAGTPVAGLFLQPDRARHERRRRALHRRRRPSWRRVSAASCCCGAAVRSRRSDWRSSR